MRLDREKFRAERRADRAARQRQERQGTVGDQLGVEQLEPAVLRAIGEQTVESAGGAAQEVIGIERPGVDARLCGGRLERGLDAERLALAVADECTRLPLFGEIP